MTKEEVRRFVLHVSEDELRILVEALAHHPNPEIVSFGPAYAIDRNRAKVLRARLRRVAESTPKRLPPLTLTLKGVS